MEDWDKSVQKQRLREAVDFHSQQQPESEQNAPAPKLETAPPASEAEPKTNETVAMGEVRKLPEKLLYASLDEGLAFFNTDGTRHVFSSPQEETELLMAAAAHMPKGAQTPGAPELELAMVGPDGKTPVIPGTPAKAESADTAMGESSAPETDPGGLRAWTEQANEDPTFTPSRLGREGEPTADELARRLQTRNEGGGGRRPPDGGSGNAGADREPQGVGRIAGAVHAQIPGEYESWRNPNPMKYDGIKILRTREDILANPRNAQLFGEMLQAMGESGDALEGEAAAEEKANIAARIERYKNGTATKDDRDFMTYATKEFSYAMKLAEDSSQHLTQQNLELFSRRNSDIENVLVQEGDKRSQELLQNAVFHMAMRRPADVDALLRNLNKLEKNRSSKQFQTWNKETEELCKAAGLKDVKNFDHLYAMGKGDRAETRKRVRERVRDDMNRFEKSVDAIAAGFGLSKTDRLMRRADWVVRMKQGTFGKAGPEDTSWMARSINWIATGSTQKKVAGADASVAHIAQFLGDTIGNDEMRGLVAKEVIENRNYKLAGEGGPKTFSDTQRLAQQEYSEVSLKTRLQNRINSDRNWNTAGNAYQDQKLEEWRREEAERHEGRGFFAWLFSILFTKNYDNAASSITGRPAHA